MIQKILIANRGEIAVRVMRTAKKMGVTTVAVYSDIDRTAKHVLEADEAIYLGKAPANDSYLRGDLIIKAAKSLQVDAIHPGYGFLSENAVFAQQVIDNGLIFIGPNPHAIRVMGSKLDAKEAVKSYDIPMVPGTDKAVSDFEEGLSIARNIGFPVLIKASAGGGGKGMRLVHSEDEVESQMERAISEAQSAFGDGAVFIEKYITSPRHIEIQILADKFGNVVHLFERECSVQRRHQKVVEEAPSAVLIPELRNQMGLAAVKVARACDYVGAGTVEFLLDEEMNFYFLEMNTRLQVEHPVTEWITGLDLVEAQIKIADDKPLSFNQEDLKITGHAIELRVYAEDPLDNFLPSIGKLETYVRPAGRGVRVDDGYEEGMEIPIYYDPLISKLITYGASREEAIQMMLKAINEYQIDGVKTTLSFGEFVCKHPAFISGQFDTGFVKKHYDTSSDKLGIRRMSRIAALLALDAYLQENSRLKVPSNRSSNWSSENFLD